MREERETQMNRTYISEIKSVLDMKAEILYLYSDCHKDVYGVRGTPMGWNDPSYTMEDAMNDMERMYDMCDAEAKRERRQWDIRQGKNHFHWLMLQEASRTEGAVVYKNENFDSYALRDVYPSSPYGETFSGDREYEYYIPKVHKNHARVA